MSPLSFLKATWQNMLWDLAKRSKEPMQSRI